MTTPPCPVSLHYDPLVCAKESDYLIVAQTDHPKANKQIVRGVDGSVTKSAGIPIREVSAWNVAVPDATTMVEFLQQVGARQDLLIHHSYQPAIPVGKRFHIISEDWMLERFTRDSEEFKTGRCEIEGEWYIQNRAVLFSPSSWILMDKDSPPGMPQEWIDMDHRQWLDVLCGLVPELSDVPVIRAGSNSSRVLVDWAPLSAGSEKNAHFWFQVADPNDIKDFKNRLYYKAVLNNWYYKKPLYASDGSGQITGYGKGTLWDQTTIRHGRWVYDGMPWTIGDGLDVLPVDVGIFQHGDTQYFNTKSVPDPTWEERQEVERRTGYKLKRENGDSYLENDTELTLDTTWITVRGDYLQGDIVVTVREFLDSGVDKYRCQTAFRASDSWNGTLNRIAGGLLVVHYDNGTQTRYYLSLQERISYLYGESERLSGPCFNAPASVVEEAKSDLDIAKERYAEVYHALPGNIRERIREDIVEGGIKWEELIDFARTEPGFGYGPTQMRNWKANLKRCMKAIEKLESEEQKWQKAKKEADRKDSIRIQLANTGGESEQRFYSFAESLKSGKGERMLQTKTVFDDGKGDPLVEVRALSSNIETILEEGAIAGVIPRFQYNTLKGSYEITQGLNGHAVLAELKNSHLQEIHIRVSRYFDTHFSKEVLRDTAETIAERNSYHPVREWLKSLTWDGVPRIDDWLIRATGCKDSLANREASRLIIIAMVSRAMNPGCLLRYMPILDGIQNIGKTSIWRELACRDDWFDEVEIKSKEEETLQKLHGVWLAEVGELKGFRRAEASDLKALISRRKDRFRRPYARYATTEPRQFVIVGTSNEDLYLTDVTGNSRYLSVHCTKADYGLVRDLREQLFAEGMVAWGNGALPMLSKRGERLWLGIQDDYREKDPWEDDIALELTHLLNPPGAPPRTHFHAYQLYPLFIGHDKEKKTKAFTNRIGRCLRALGYEPDKKRDDRQWRAIARD